MRWRLLASLVLSALLIAPAASAAPASTPAAKPQAAAAARVYVAGVHYQVLTAPVPTRDPRKVEVVELFSYGCPHCYDFEPAVAAWKARQLPDVDFRAVPVLFNPQFRILAQAFYSAQALKVADRSHTALFRAIHVEHRPLWLTDELTRFYSSYGISAANFSRTMESFGVRTAMQRAQMLSDGYRLSGVPAMAVNGKYLTDGRMAGTNEAMLAVVDYLVRKERDALQARVRPAPGR